MALHSPARLEKRASQETVRQLNSITPVSRETIGRLENYHELLCQWQAKTNLVSPNTLADYWTRHVADSAQVLPLARRLDGSLPRAWLDLGSGGGFPGLVLAILLADENYAANQGDGPFQLALIESIQKKCAFLRRVVAECEIPADRVKTEVVCARIESVPERMRNADVVTARALASLEQLLAWAEPALSPDRRPPARALFHKGRDFQREIEESRGSWKFDLIHHPSRIDPESVVLEITGVEPAGSV